MAPKRGTKRKAPATNGEVAATLSPPDRETWQGWVEMESEPAFFNVMLKDMGVRGVRVQEVYGLDDNMLAILPRPVHALIFLFRYRATDSLLKEKGSCPKTVWFANQTPDFACASFALLNIVNNIPNLHLGRQLSNFKEATKDMSPLQRGEAVDNFAFVKRVHNSFARENELLQAEVAMREKSNKFKKKQAQAKARATREAKKEAKDKETVVQKSHSSSTPIRSSGRSKKLTPKAERTVEDADHDYDPNHTRMGAETASGYQGNGRLTGVRRSTRTPKPRKTDFTEYQDRSEGEEDGFHFIAYMPIDGHVWRLDGLNKYPQDLGSFDASTGWMDLALPALGDRMAQAEGAEIEFNLMAVVHDQLVDDREALLENIRTIKAYDKKLDEVYDDWRAFEGAETPCNTIMHTSPAFDVSDFDINAARVPCKVQKVIDEGELLGLVRQRAEVIRQQTGLRYTVLETIQASRSDQEKADRRRRDYTGFVRGWLEAIAEQGLLPLLEQDAIPDGGDIPVLEDGESSLDRILKDRRNARS